MDTYLVALDEMEAAYAEAHAEQERQERRQQMFRERTTGRDEGRRDAEQMLNRVQAPQMREAVQFGVAKLLREWIPAANRSIQNVAHEISAHAEKAELRVPALHDSWLEETDAKAAVVTLQMTIPSFHQRIAVAARRA